MRRRFLTAGLGAALLMPIETRGQQAVKVYRVAVLTRAGASNNANERTGLRYVVLG